MSKIRASLQWPSLIWVLYSRGLYLSLQMQPTLSTWSKSSLSTTPFHSTCYTSHKHRNTETVWEMYGIRVSLLFFCLSCGLGCALRPALLHCLVLCWSPLQELPTAGRGFSAGSKAHPTVTGNRVTWTWGYFFSLYAVLHSFHLHLAL